MLANLRRLFRALGFFADEVDALAETVREVRMGIRGHLGLDTPEREQLPGGEVIEEPEPANGRRKKGGR